MAKPADPADLGVLESAALLRCGELSATELLAACQARIEEANGGEPSFDGAPGAVNAWIRLYPELAEELAAAADARIAKGGEEAPLLCGVPIGLKDLYGVAGLPVTASSRVLEDRVAEADCTAWARLRGEGMVLLGHTHTHEFAAGGTTDQVGNPWALDRSAGGSSGGSAAALASGMVPAALGTDTLGSLRIPSALCGTSAVKATHGRVPIDGIVPLAHTLDHAGPMARSIADCSALLGALADPGPQSSPLLPPPAPIGPLPVQARPGSRPLEGLKLALTDRPGRQPLDEDVAAGLKAAREACESLGAVVVEHPAPAELAAEHMSAVLFGDMWAQHRDYADRADRYRPSIGALVGAAAGCDAPTYVAAQQARDAFTVEWEGWFARHGVDFLLEPTVPLVAEPRGEGYELGNEGGEGDPLIAFTATWDLTGFPVASLPAGLGAVSGLPVGVSLVGQRGTEAPLLQAAIDLQEHALAPPRPPEGATTAPR